MKVSKLIYRFSKTFNWDNFKNYWNPDTSYTELKDYSKSVIQTGATVYSGVKIVQSVAKAVGRVTSPSTTTYYNNTAESIVSNKPTIKGVSKAKANYTGNVSDKITKYNTIKKYPFDSQTGLFGKQGDSYFTRELLGEEFKIKNFLKDITRKGKNIGNKTGIEGSSTYSMRDGTYITYRPVSKSGPPTIDISRGKQWIQQKIKFK